jgi:hypothetical protein
MEIYGNVKARALMEIWNGGRTENTMAKGKGTK